jgi:hypothetical protein
MNRQQEIRYVPAQSVDIHGAAKAMAGVPLAGTAWIPRQ